MNRLGQIMRVLFWLPILVAGFTGFTFVAPHFEKYRLPGMILLALFIVLGLVHSIVDRMQQRAEIVARAKRSARGNSRTGSEKLPVSAQVD
jgi:hypothetical protein